MSDQRNSSPSPWMRPMHAQQLLRPDPARSIPEPAGPYTPNEPDHNEAVYAARAAAAHQQAMTRQAAAPQPHSAVQQAVEQAARQAHAARQVSQPQRMERYAPAPQPVQPAAVFYQQSTGVQQPMRQPVQQQPVRPAQPHRLPMDAYPAQPVRQQPVNGAAPAPVYAAAPSRQLDASVLTDPMLMEEAHQPASRRRRMVMRQDQEIHPQTGAPQAPVQAAVQTFAAQPVAASAPVAAPMESIPVMPQLEPQPAVFPQPKAKQTPPAVDPIGETQPMADPLAATQSMLLPDAPAAQTDPLSATQLDPSQPPADFFEMPLENPLKQYTWYAEDVLEEDDEPEEDCMDTASMPIPAPVSTLDLPKMRRGKSLLTVLLVLMLLAAAGAFLWLSGYGETLYRHAVNLVDSIQNPTTSIGPMTVTPESAALPATLTVTFTTDFSVSSVKLIDDQGKDLPARITPQFQNESTFWTCSLKMEEPYDGYIRAKLLCSDGQWHIGSEKRHVALN